MPPARILVIAANLDLRRSVSFALEADGHVVTSHAALVDSRETTGYGCVVLDHRAAASAPVKTVLDFCAHAPPVVFLAGRPQPDVASNVFRVVETPHLGEALTRAVQAALLPMPLLEAQTPR